MQQINFLLPIIYNCFSTVALCGFFSFSFSKWFILILKSYIIIYCLMIVEFWRFIFLIRCDKLTCLIFLLISCWISRFAMPVFIFYSFIQIINCVWRFCFKLRFGKVNFSSKYLFILYSLRQLLSLWIRCTILLALW